MIICDVKTHSQRSEVRVLLIPYYENPCTCLLTSLLAQEVITQEGRSSSVINFQRVAGYISFSCAVTHIQLVQDLKKWLLQLLQFIFHETNRRAVFPLCFLHLFFTVWDLTVAHLMASFCCALFFCNGLMASDWKMCFLRICFLNVLYTANEEYRVTANPCILPTWTS